VGGLVGKSWGTGTGAGQFSTIKNNYSRATITTSADNVAGVVGYAGYTKLLSNYFAGVANDTDGAATERGIVGTDWGSNTITDNFYDTEVCVAASSQCSTGVIAEARGIDTTAMKSVASFLRTGGWDFRTVWTMPGQVYAGQYPVFLWESGQSALAVAYGGGNGTSSTPYLIGNASQYYSWMNDSDDWINSSYFRLTGNINMGGAHVAQIGNAAKPFNGTFDGAGFTVSNMLIDGTADESQVGFFGNISATGAVDHLVLSSITVRGNGSLGGVAGYSAGKVSRTGVSGNSLIESSTSTGDLGGVTGYQYKPGLIEDSFSGSSVTIRNLAGGYNLGGITGQAMGTATSAGNAVTIRNSYSHASITANGVAMGGILGYAGYATVSSNYFAGIVNDTSGTDNERGVVGYDWSQNTLLNNFFDTDVCTTGSGCASSVYVEARPRNTVQMKSVATYLRTGAWDFLTKWTTPGQVYNGQYPVLLWEA
ncbi:MAG: hypothetical protein AAB425_15800, partial [Bdellovibrionota bacterium]